MNDTSDMDDSTGATAPSDEVADFEGVGLAVEEDIDVNNETFTNFDSDGIAVVEDGVTVGLDEVEATSNGDDGFEIRGGVSEVSVTANQSSFNLNGDDGIDVFGQNNTIDLFRVEAAFNEAGGLGVDGLNNTFNIGHQRI